MSSIKKEFGQLPGGEPVWLYQLENNNGMRVEVLSYGARVRAIYVKDNSGHRRNVVLGHDGLQSYITDTAYLGATIGRYCNRIENACFPLDGKTVGVVANAAANQLHGGAQGFDKQLWSLKRIHTGSDAPGRTKPAGKEAQTLTLEYISVAGEQGFPGNLHTTVRYQLSEDNQLYIDLSAQTDATTIVNLTNHSYFNLHGDATRPVLDHQVKIDADAFLPMKDTFVPTGEVAAVHATPFDFRQFREIGAAMRASNVQIKLASGFDHNWVLNQNGGLLADAAQARSLLTGIELRVATTQPGVQFYTGNNLESDGFGKHAGLCFETQHFPNSPNEAEFPSTVLQPGAKYSERTIYAFGLLKK